MASEAETSRSPGQSTSDLSYELRRPSGPVSIQLPFVVGVLADLFPSPVHGVRLNDSYLSKWFKPTQPKDEDHLPVVPDRRFHYVNRSTFDDFMAFMAPTVCFDVPDLITGGRDLTISLFFSRLEDFQPHDIARQVPELVAFAQSDEVGLPRSSKEKEQLDIILHHAELRRLIGTWCGLYLLADQVSANNSPTAIRVLHLSRKEFGKTIKKFKGTAWDQSPLFKKLYEQEYGQPGGHPYGCVIGDYYFDHSLPHIEMLSGIAQIAAAAHFPFLSAAAPTLLQLESWREVNPQLDPRFPLTANSYAPFRALRENPVSRHLFLAAPELRIRLSALLKFGGSQRIHDADVGRMDLDVTVNPAYVLASGLVKGFQESGWFSNDFRENALPAVLAGGSLSTPQAPLEGIEDKKRSFVTVLHELGINYLTSRVDNGVQLRPTRWLYDAIDPQLNPDSTDLLAALCCQNRVHHYLKAMGRDHDQLTVQDILEPNRWLSRFQFGPEDAETPLFHHIDFTMHEERTYSYNYRDTARFTIELGRGFESPGPKVEVDVVVAEAQVRQTPAPEIVVGVLLDLSQFVSERKEVADRELLEITIDNFDDRLKWEKSRVAFEVPNTITGEGTIEVDLTFGSLEDFEPLAVAQMVEPLKRLLAERLAIVGLFAYMDVDPQRSESLLPLLNTPEGVLGLASKIQAWRKDLRSSFSPTEPSALGERTLLWTKGHVSEKSEQEVYEAFQTLHRWLEHVPTVPRSQVLECLCRLVDEIDQRLDRQLNHILQHQDFRTLESIWRGLWCLVQTANGDPRVRIRFIDISKNECRAECRKARSPAAKENNPIFRKIVLEEREWGGESYDFLVADYAFGRDEKDGVLLSDLCKIADASDAKLYVSVTPDFVGLQSWDQANAAVQSGLTARSIVWNHFRQRSESQRAVLVAPDLLARAPYARDPGQIRAFEHQASAHGANAYVWCRSTFSAAAHLIEARLGLKKNALPHGTSSHSTQNIEIGNSRQAWNGSVVAALRESGVEAMPFEPILSIEAPVGKRTREDL